jgi:hypothetical protein
MKGLNEETQKAAQSYVDMADGIAKIGQGITLWGAGLISAKGEMGFIGRLVEDTANSWAYMAGMKSKAEEQDQLANKSVLENAKMVQLRNELRIAIAQEEKLTGSESGNFGEVVRESASSATKALREYGVSLGMTIQQIQAFQGGSSLAKVRDKAFKDPAQSKAGSTVKPMSDITIDKPTEDYFQQELDAEKEYLDGHKKLQDEKYQNDLKLAQEFAKTEYDLRQKAMDQAKADRDAQMMSMQAGFGATAQIAGALSQLATVSAGKNKEMAKNALTLSEVVAIANVAEGVTKAFAQGGVLGFITGGAVGIAGLAQIATIEQQKQKLADGGIIRGPSTGDTVPVMANGGEMMLTKSDQSSVLQLIRGGGSAGGGITYAPTINSSNPAQVKQMLRENKSEFASFVMSVMRDPSNSRARAFA